MTLVNVAYTLKFDSNLISLGQLCKSGILYHDHPDSMILKQGRSTIGVAKRYKNLFILETGLRDKAILMQGKGQPTYLLSSNPHIRFWHCRLGHASNARVIQASKLIDGIDLGEAIGPDNKLYSSDSEPYDENNKSDKDADSKPTTINKTTEYNLNGVEELCETCIESKHTRIVKSKKMTPTTKRLQEVHADLWGPHKPAFISEKNYIALLFDKFTRKS